MKATEILMQEHDLILSMIDLIDNEVESQLANGTVRVERLESMVDFIRNFADGCHHDKEEKGLFIKLNDAGMPPDSGPVAVMLHEHDQGRAFVKQVADALSKANAGDKAAIEQVSKGLRGYSVLLSNHIMKENEILFPMADQMLPMNDQEELAAQFDAYQHSEGKGLYEKYKQMVEELSS